MQEQIRGALRPFRRIQFSRSFGRMYIHLNHEPYEAVANVLRHVFGVASFSRVARCASELGEIEATCVKVMHHLRRQPQSFKVTVKRTDKKFPYDTMQLLPMLGDTILDHFPDITVDVHHPEVTLKVEIQPEGTIVYNDSVRAVGGFPYGTNGRAMLLLSGGIDSPVAGYLAMRKGLELEAVHFHSYPFTSEQAKQKMLTLAQKLVNMSGMPMKVHLVKFTELQTSFTTLKQDHLIITFMRRAMLRITEQLAVRSDALAVVTGDSLGQVASQTLRSMNVIGRVLDLPLLRPLITLDKNDIITYARAIDTYETSILPYEDCCTLFVPKHPSTNPNLNVVEKVESYIENYTQMLQEAIDTTETITLTPGTEFPQVTMEAHDDWF
jgi:thiamine biosynthesis protein ThiI